MIKHIVMWSFKKGEEQNMDLFLNNLKSLQGQIDFIKSMEVKKSINENNEFDAVLISEFESLEDLENYKIHPQHIKVSQLCKSIRTNRSAIDIEA